MFFSCNFQEKWYTILIRQKKVRLFMNPMQLLQIVNIWKKFCANHPRFPMFLQAVGKEGLTEDSVISIEVKTPEGKTYNANVKLLASDMELIDAIKQIKP